MKPDPGRRTLQARVYAVLEDMLMMGQFEPGQRLTVREVAERLGTSSMPVREAFQRLTTEGALELLSTGAIRVRLLDDLGLDRITKIRVAVEWVAARRAATRITDEELNTLEHIDRELRQGLRANDAEAVAAANERFHLTVYRAAHSAELSRIIKHLWLHLGPHVAWLLKRGELGERTSHVGVLRHHKAVLAALKRRDPDQAGQAVRADAQMTAKILRPTRARSPDVDSQIRKAVLVRRTLKDIVYDYLRTGLMTGEIAPSQHLTVRGVAATVGTSAMPVREAFRRLISEGALEPLSTGATRVPVLDRARLQDLIEVRATVEGLAAREAAQRVTDAELIAIERANDDVRAAVGAGDAAGEAKANERFHFAIYDAADSIELMRIIEHLWVRAGPILAWAGRENPAATREQGNRSVQRHRSIVTALRRRDPARAEAALRADILKTGDILIAITQEGEASQHLSRSRVPRYRANSASRGAS